MNNNKKIAIATTSSVVLLIIDKTTNSTWIVITLGGLLVAIYWAWVYVSNKKRIYRNNYQYEADKLLYQKLKKSFSEVQNIEYLSSPNAVKFLRLAIDEIKFLLGADKFVDLEMDSYVEHIYSLIYNIEGILRRVSFNSLELALCGESYSDDDYNNKANKLLEYFKNTLIEMNDRWMYIESKL